ncbi:MAG: diacylglycerol kinase family protein [Bacteroidia bacterium]
MNNNKSFSIGKRLKSFEYAIEGIVTFFKTQHNAWIHCLATIAVIISGYKLNVNNMEWCMLIIAIALVMITEMLNTSIEFLTDKASPEYHPLAKKVKDIAAGAVLCAAIVAIIIGAFVFLPKF